MYPEHHSIKPGHQSRCQVCNSDKIRVVLDLGHQPLCDTLLTKEMLNEAEATYPLRMCWCPDCTLAQIDYCVDGSLVYHPDYPYRSGITKELSEYQAAISKSLIAQYGLRPADLVIDIGSNDGTLLSGFKRDGIRALGVEPTNIAKIAVENGIDTVQEFFTVKTARAIKKKYGPAAVIVSTNTFAHMASLGEVVAGIELLLRDGGVFVSETHYLLDVLRGGQFDTIYHEHLRTYSLASLIRLFSYYNFTVTDAERGSRYGGNLRIHATKGKNKPAGPNVARLLALEEEAGLGKFETYEAFARRVKKARREFTGFVFKAAEQGKTVVGNSCPGRCVTLLNYYGMDPDWIPYIAEQPASLKLWKYLPGKHIPVVNNEILIKEQPDFVILLAWHYAEPIRKQLEARGLKSDFIVPLPDFKIVKNGS
jgi:SAM-dependent methyltransferase